MDVRRVCPSYRRMITRMMMRMRPPIPMYMRFSPNVDGVV